MIFGVLFTGHPTAAQCVLEEDAKLTASDAAAMDVFGRSISVSGDTVVVGAPWDDDAGTDSGSAYVFVRSGGVWTQQQKLTALDAAAGDSFGVSVSVSADTAVVGAYHDDGVSGSAYVYVRTGGVWSQQQKLTASDAAAGDLFGRSVSVSEDTAVIGAEGDDDAGDSSGSAYVFVRAGGVWAQQQKLTASDAAADDLFGYSVSVSGDTAVAGAFAADDAGSQSGSAYVYVRTGAVWTQQQKLTASDALADDWFGHSVSVSGDTALVGAIDGMTDDPGSAYVYVRSAGVWTQQQKLTASDAVAGDRFGSVSLSGDTAVVGAYNGFSPVVQSGAAYVFVRSGGVWTQQWKLTASDAAGGDAFGQSVSLSGDTAVVGAQYNDDAGGASGSAYVFELESPPPPVDCNANGIPDECDITNCTGAPACADCNDNAVPDGCELGQVLWTLRSDTGATPRQLGGLAYDSARSVTVLFGGNNGSSHLGDTWEWDGATWTLRNLGDPNGEMSPPPRSLFATAYDAARIKTVVFGGYGPTNKFGDTWGWDGGTWTLLHAGDPNGITAPTPRRGTAMVYDSGRGVIVLFGGSDGELPGETLRGDTWEWNGQSWILRQPKDPSGVTAPSPRGGHAMAYDSARGLTVLFGGVSTPAACGIPPRCDDTWEYNGTDGTWTKRVVLGPGERNEHAMAYDPSLGVTVLFGGHEETSDYGDTWEWNGIPWTLNPSAGSTPRSGMPMAFDSGRNVTVMFGGLGTQYLDDTWEYGPAGQDCNANQIPDECDIAAGISTDCQPDGIPDECTCLTMSAAQPEPVVQAKNRYLAFDPNNECVKAAIRVTFTDLPPPFEALEDQRRWVGPPVETCEDALVVSAPCLRGSFTLASLQCESFFTDWGPWGLLHVTGPEIVPNATYTVELVHEGCDIANNADYSTGLPVPTIGKWADVVPAFGGPTQPNFADIAAVTDKFRDAPSAVSKARTDLVANVPDRKVNFSDIAAATDAFRGFPYPFTGPASCP